jgi:hypothetical protein
MLTWSRQWSHSDFVASPDSLWPDPLGSDLYKVAFCRVAPISLASTRWRRCAPWPGTRKFPRALQQLMFIEYIHSGTIDRNQIIAQSDWIEPSHPRKENSVDLALLLLTIPWERFFNAPPLSPELWPPHHTIHQCTAAPLPARRPSYRLDPLLLLGDDTILYHSSNSFRSQPT